MVFNKEIDFEHALIELLTHYGWNSEIIKNPTEKDLLKNWANILFENNRGIDRLNDYPLTDGEMQQIVEQINNLKTPLLLNGFINGGSVAITRDNPDDTAHFGKEVSLKIYDRLEIQGGQSRYQIAEQPKFPTKSKIFNDRRGDLMLLVNGMPVVHIELKKSGVPVSQAAYQIEKYAGEGIFTGIFALVQIFVAMNPDETLYFANPGPEGKFNPDFYFHWADFNNEPINDWKDIASSLLSIPMVHWMVGFYTVADGSDGILKVMRSYQYYAAREISTKVKSIKWEGGDQLGGYIWHTTGSGKTMTSFKSAQLIATSKDADKVVFLMDRIELGTQSLKEYRNFAGAGLSEQQKANTVQETEDTVVLIGKLKSDNPADTLIVTSIQKMSNVSEDFKKLKAADLAVIASKRIVFIVDECHRSVFGAMLLTIKHTFPKAIFFGFTGTPIQDENQVQKNTTATVFGNELHRYSIADGIRDGNVLGFDPYKVLTFADDDLRTQVALEQAKAKTVEEAFADPSKKKKFLEFKNKVPMAGHYESDGSYTRGIEDYVQPVQYRTEVHQSKVVEDILKNWFVLSQNSKFHAIFATSSIPEALEYYKRIKAAKPDLKVTALFDPSIDNEEGATIKENGLKELIEDYNERYNQNFAIPTWAKMKKDIAARLAHKKPYVRIEREPEKQIDLLIVVNQMLTGFDSKWINTLYLDKILEYANVIQAFSRTNRLFGKDEKPFGTIKYYRMPHTMEKKIEAAVKLYSGNKPLGLFAQRLGKNLLLMNTFFTQIKDLFELARIPNFENLPEEPAERKKFASLFREFNDYLAAARIQGFTWDKLTYKVDVDNSSKKQEITLALNETTYLILAMRYKELFSGKSGSGGDDVPYDIDGYLTTIDTGKIDSDYMNSRFEKFFKLLQTKGVDADDLEKAEAELHKTFATLTQEEQKYADMFLRDIQSGNVKPEKGKTLRDYITDYMGKAHDDKIHRFAKTFGFDEEMLRVLMSQDVNAANINEYGRLDALKNSVKDTSAAARYFENTSGRKLSTPKVKIKLDDYLRKFILEGGFDLE